MTGPVEAALKFGRAHFAAGERHGLEDFLVAKLGLLVRLFGRPRGPALSLLICVRVVFSHKGPRVRDRLWGQLGNRLH